MTLAVVASLGTEKKSQILNVKFNIDLENFMHFKLDTPMYQDTFSTSERNVSYINKYLLYQLCILIFPTASRCPVSPPVYRQMCLTPPFISPFFSKLSVLKSS